jgi:hypothetical protein|tara:strand:+ start:41 stop:235 length:195 start_codon:yes stop_codon:yes gene_type:complete
MNIYTDVTKQKADMKTAIDAFLACDGMIEVLPSKKNPKPDLFFSRNIPGSIAHRGFSKANNVGF